MVVFTYPVIGIVGMTEPWARDAYGDGVEVFTSKFTPVFYRLTASKLLEAIRFIAPGNKRKIAGCHVIGDGADGMMPGSVVIKMSATKEDVDNTVTIDATSAEEFVTLS